MSQLCKWGKSCKYYKQNKCKFLHDDSDVNELTQQFASTMTLQQCKWGSSCKFLKQNRCKYAHDNSNEDDDNDDSSGDNNDDSNGDNNDDSNGDNNDDSSGDNNDDSSGDNNDDSNGDNNDDGNDDSNDNNNEDDSDEKNEDASHEYDENCECLDCFYIKYRYEYESCICGDCDNNDPKINFRVYCASTKCGQLVQPYSALCPGTRNIKQKETIYHNLRWCEFMCSGCGGELPKDKWNGKCVSNFACPLKNVKYHGGLVNQHRVIFHGQAKFKNNRIPVFCGSTKCGKQIDWYSDCDDHCSNFNSIMCAYCKHYTGQYYQYHDNGIFKPHYRHCQCSKRGCQCEWKKNNKYNGAIVNNHGLIVH